MTHTGVLGPRSAAAQNSGVKSISINSEDVRGGCGAGQKD